MGLTGRRGQEASKVMDGNAMHLGKCLFHGATIWGKKSINEFLNVCAV